MSDTNGNPSRQEAYLAPQSELYTLASEQIIMSFSREGDNEITIEEPLF